MEDRERIKEWRQTEIGKAFLRFESACSHYWQKDLDEGISDKRLRELHDKMEQTRKEFLLLIRGF